MRMGQIARQIGVETVQKVGVLWEGPVVVTGSSR